MEHVWLDIIMMVIQCRDFRMCVYAPSPTDHDGAIFASSAPTFPRRAFTFHISERRHMPRTTLLICFVRTEHLPNITADFPACNGGFLGGYRYVSEIIECAPALTAWTNCPIFSIIILSYGIRGVELGFLPMHSPHHRSSVARTHSFTCLARSSLTHTHSPPPS